MPKMKKWKSGRSNLIKITLLFLLAATAILVVQFGKFEPNFILPDERALREERRASPDNAYPILLEAVRLLPRPRPHAQRNPVGGRRGETRRLRPPLDSAGSILQIGRDEDDPELIEYILSAAPALEKAREALDKPFFVFEEPVDSRRGETQQQCVALVLHLLATARLAAFVENRPDEAPQTLIETIRLARLMHQDSQITVQIERMALRQVLLFARKYGQTESLDPLHEALSQLGVPFSDPAQLLKIYWRQLDLRQLGYGLGDRGSIAGRYELFRYRKLARKIIEEKEQYRKLTEGTLSELQQWRRENWKLIDQGSLSPHYQNMVFAMEQSVTTNADYHATTLVLALERYNADNKTYPPQLSDLSPNYIKEIPKDPITADSFLYRRTDTDYLLYSQGENGKDDNGTPNQDIIYVGKQRN